MILCVNPNAAIDRTLIVNPFRLNQIHRPQQVMALPGGKGCNVARALKRLGERPVVMGWAGGHAGSFIEDGLSEEEIGTDFVHTGSESRTCLSIIDETKGSITEIYERGPAVPATSVEALYERFRRVVGDYAAVTLSGSLPPSVPSTFYADLIAIAQEAGVPALLDSSGQPLQRGATARPYLVKPNRKEFATLQGEQPQSLPDFAAAAREMAQHYETRVVLSLGADGVLATAGAAVRHVQAPPVTALSPVGSGDCLLAGLAYGLTHDFSFDDALRHGVAAATANTLRLGAGNFTLADFERVREAITIEMIR